MNLQVDQDDNITTKKSNIDIGPYRNRFLRAALPSSASTVAEVYYDVSIHRHGYDCGKGSCGSISPLLNAAEDPPLSRNHFWQIRTDRAKNNWDVVFASGCARAINTAQAFYPLWGDGSHQHNSVVYAYDAHMCESSEMNGISIGVPRNMPIQIKQNSGILVGSFIDAIVGTANTRNVVTASTYMTGIPWVERLDQGKLDVARASFSAIRNLDILDIADQAYDTVFNDDIVTKAADANSECSLFQILHDIDFIMERVPNPTRVEDSTRNTWTDMRDDLRLLIRSGRGTRNSPFKIAVAHHSHCIKDFFDGAQDILAAATVDSDDKFLPSAGVTIKKVVRAVSNREAYAGRIPAPIEGDCPLVENKDYCGYSQPDGAQCLNRAGDKETLGFTYCSRFQVETNSVTTTDYCCAYQDHIYGGSCSNDHCPGGGCAVWNDCVPNKHKNGCECQ